MHLIRGAFRRRSPSPQHAVPVVRPPDLLPEVEAARSQAEDAAESLREALRENEQLHESFLREQSKSESADDRLQALECEATQSIEAAEKDEENRQEQVTVLRRRSVIATEEVSELRRSSFERDAALEELRQRVAAGLANRDEWQECEATTERVRVEANLSRREMTEAEEWHEEATNAAEYGRNRRLEDEAEIRLLAEELAEAQAEAQRRDDSYWEDAPFLMANADIVIGYQAEIEESNEVALKIEGDLADEKRKHEEKLQEIREAAALCDDSFLATADSRRPPGVGVAEAAQPKFASPPYSPLPFLEPTSLSPRQCSPVQATLEALDLDNKRLRQKIQQLRGEVEAAAPGGSTMTTRSPLPGQGSFDAAVAGTGARVVDQMKRALHDDVALLRNLHQVKQELDRERRRERRARANLERRINNLGILPPLLQPGPIVDASVMDAEAVHQP